MAVHTQGTNRLPYVSATGLSQQRKATLSTKITHTVTSKDRPLMRQCMVSKDIDSSLDITINVNLLQINMVIYIPNSITTRSEEMQA